ncbi:hypothetical protein EV215_0644 [Hypnocyclicus thermotrophus]|uniref:Uncharacterized protein n=1 Tax=Hypnocyclicus thermotrophus TaxID=1627895 RepID=A0AA46I625_9FUSO|nr:hypothetical protein EV215_0644 [Hypnocyclicus thermotrophus]
MKKIITMVLGLMIFLGSVIMAKGNTNIVTDTQNII